MGGDELALGGEALQVLGQQHLLQRRRVGSAFEPRQDHRRLPVGRVVLGDCSVGDFSAAAAAAAAAATASASAYTTTRSKTAADFLYCRCRCCRRVNTNYADPRLVDIAVARVATRLNRRQRTAVCCAGGEMDGPRHAPQRALHPRHGRIFAETAVFAGRASCTIIVTSVVFVVIVAAVSIITTTTIIIIIIAFAVRVFKPNTADAAAAAATATMTTRAAAAVTALVAALLDQQPCPFEERLASSRLDLINSLYQAVLAPTKPDRHCTGLRVVDKRHHSAGPTEAGTREEVDANHRRVHAHGMLDDDAAQAIPAAVVKVLDQPALRAQDDPRPEAILPSAVLAAPVAGGERVFLDRKDLGATCGTKRHAAQAGPGAWVPTHQSHAARRQHKGLPSAGLCRLSGESGGY